MTLFDNNKMLTDLDKSQLSFLEKEAELVYRAIRDNLKLLINSLTIGVSFSGASLITPLVQDSGSSTGNTKVTDILLNLLKISPLKELQPKSS